MRRMNGQTQRMNSNQYKKELIPQYADMAIAMTIKIPTNVAIITGSEPKNNITRAIPPPK